MLKEIKGNSTELYSKMIQWPAALCRVRIGSSNFHASCPTPPMVTWREEAASRSRTITWRGVACCPLAGEAVA